MRSKSINVHALMDESEDPLELLEAYFNSTVLNLTESGLGSQGGSQGTVSSPTVISPFAHQQSAASSSSATATASAFSPTSSDRQTVLGGNRGVQSQTLTQTQMELDTIQIRSPASELDLELEGMEEV